MEKNSKICVLGHRGLVGSALVQELLAQEFTHIRVVPRTEVDLRNPDEGRGWFSCHEPQ